ncbi:MAG: hypothetical protein DRG24_01095 [Epsilonproteobacteria bacterium]|nr:MAG: hypothetical protein DRG24_01095 [Campylobacterota bacterium]
MQISKVLAYFYTKVFIGIVHGRAQTDITVLTVRGSSISHHYTRKFDGIECSDAMQTFIEEAAELSPLFFTAVLCDAAEQGAIPTCSKQHAGQFTDVDFLESICFDEKWMIYLSRDALYHLQERYKRIGVDFIFSPFALIKQLYKEQISREHALFILNEETSVSLAVFDKGEFQFAAYEKIGVSDLSSEKQDDIPKRFKSIEKILDIYYHDVRYKSSFIEKIYLADTQKNTDTIVTLMKNELFIDVEYASIDLAYEVAKLAATEAKYAL